MSKPVDHNTPTTSRGTGGKEKPEKTRLSQKPKSNKDPPNDPHSQIATSNAGDANKARVGENKSPISSRIRGAKKKRSCVMCPSVDHGRMVQCVICSCWCHFDCAGVSEDIEQCGWTCLECSTAKANSSKQKTSKTKTRGAVQITKPTKVSAKKKNSGKPKPVKDSTSKMLRTDPTGGENPTDLDAMLLAEIEKKETVLTKAKSIKSGSTNKSALSLKLQMQQVLAEETLMLEEMRRRREFMKKKFELMEEIAEVRSCPVPGAKTTDPLTKVKGWLQRQVASDVESDDATEESGADGSDGDVEETDSNDESAAEEEEEEEDAESQSEDNDEASDSVSDDTEGENSNNHERFTPRDRSTPGHATNHGSSRREKHSRVSATLTREQIAARQVSCNLPKFSGNPEDWPMFISTFDSTTSMCGYRDEENMIRLRSCLKDEAFAAVRSFLMHPSMVPKAISVLKLRFGQPHMVINTLRDKVLALPPVRADSIEKLVDYAIAVQNLCSTIDACGRKEYMRDVTLMQELVCKLPPAIKLDWARYTKKSAKVNLTTFSDWIFSIAEDASIVANPRKSNIYEQETRSKRQGKAFVNTHVDSSSASASGQKAAGNRVHNAFNEKVFKEESNMCLVCKGSCRTAAKCKRFLDLSYEARWTAVRELKLCRRCLRRHGGNCNSKVCGVNECTFKHNSLLHKNLAVPSEAVVSSNQANAKEERSVNTHQVEAALELFRYLPVTLFGPKAKVECYAFLDDGSELTLMDEQIAHELELAGDALPLCLKWTGGAHRFEEKSRQVNVGICGVNGKRFDLSGVRTVEALELPYQSLNVDVMKSKFQHLRDVPVESYTRVRPRILIGVKHANVSLVRRCREGKIGEPIAVKTHLGWTIFGGWSNHESADGSYIYHICACNHSDEERLHQEVKQYFSLDSLGIMAPVSSTMSKDDEKALALLNSLTRAVGSKYETGLLWRFDEIRLPDSRPMAIQRLKCLQRRLANDAQLKLAYDEKLADYLAKGYIRRVSTEELEQNKGRIWYLPTFPVINPNKPGKIRIVWDAAAMAHGVSLNSVLLTGPDMLSSLVAVLNQFREYRFGICGDIREMFLQIGIRPEDQYSQLFLWNDSTNDGEPSTFVVPVMIFGARSSPTTAQFVKNQNARRFQAEFPVAVEAIERKHYVDDMLASTETETEAIELAKSVKHVHAQGGFDIRNWVSNSTKVLEALEESPTGEKSLNLTADIATEKVLGMWWNTSTDCFTVKICWSRFDAALFDGSRAPTKRELLRILMSIFDPLGLISHYLMVLKVTLQEVWRMGLKWDDQIEGSQFESWKAWIKLLPRLEELQIPRCFRQVTTVGDHNRIQMHTFVDAGDNGMAAVVYLRFEEHGNVECALVGAKTRVAPLKYLSTPRSELQAAVIGTRLADSISKSLSLSISQRFFWCDSRNVLCWLRSDHRRYSQYVAARVSEILETTEVTEWNWVKSEWNVADDGTKWTGQMQLKSRDRWFQGPAFLQQPEQEWPSSPNMETTSEEIKFNVLVHVHGEVAKAAVEANKYSSWRRLTKVTAYVQRFVSNLRAKQGGLPLRQGLLSSEELQQAQFYHFRQAQVDVFNEEVKVLQQAKTSGDNQRKQVPRNSRIYKMSPFLDEECVLRMNSRAAKCHFLFPDEKYPIILPDDHPVTNLVLADFHERYHHRNYATVANEVRRRYCIPRLRRTLRRMRCKCVWCRNRDAAPAPPEMAELPNARLAAFSRPFSHVGVDYFGPIEVIVGRRVEKRWGVLLTCLTSRALHIEVANSLSTSSCMMALNNFIARRGTPVCFYSDKGTNFVGASKELRDALRAIDNHAMAKEFTTPTTTWRFNPPASPHMGGSWERLIQSVKRNLTEVLKSKRPTDEELRSALIQIESVLNSRPLTEVPVDNEAEPALTPNHFLLGSSDGSKPLTLCDDSVQVLRRGWQVSQMMANMFWRRWLTNYLPVITRRTKWFKKVKPIAVGDVVVIADPELPRNCWPKGRVIGTVEKGGQVRRATVQTSKGVYERPAVKLAVLDVWSESG